MKITPKSLPLVLSISPIATAWADAGSCLDVPRDNPRSRLFVTEVSVAGGSGRSAGQALDEGLRLLHQEAQCHCSSGMYAYKAGPAETLLSYETGTQMALAQIVSVWVSQKFSCGPW